MEQVVDFLELKAKRNGSITPLMVAESIMEYIKKNGDIEQLAVVVKHRDGVIDTANSTMQRLELVGLWATAQSMEIENMDEPKR